MTQGVNSVNLCYTVRTYIISTPILGVFMCLHHEKNQK
jgi:hypothetical protein